MCRSTDQYGEVGDFGDGLADTELEGNVGQEQDEAELQAVLDLVHTHCVRGEYQAAEENLQGGNKTVASQLWGTIEGVT